MSLMAYIELSLYIPDEARQALASYLQEKGSLGFVEEESRMIAYFPETVLVESLVAELRLLKEVLIVAGRSGEFEFTVNTIQDQDWNESWKKGFKALDVGQRFTILPPWEKQHAGRINLVIDPGMAFGTGHHETTRSCLILMEKYDSRIAKDRFLDLGTGTGLLAIAAAKLGYREVLAVDTDPLATEATRMNARLNSVSSLDIRDGSISAVDGLFDCVTANIISGVLVLLADQIAHRLKSQGMAILSGILSEQVDEVVAAAEQASMQVKEAYPDGKWMSLVVQLRKTE